MIPIDPDGVAWYLETHLDGGRLWRVPVKPLPFRVGRLAGLQLMVPSDAVSGEHAEIRGSTSQLRLCDLGSTNGTFINRERIVGESPLRDGDIIHFADFEFRVSQEVPQGGGRRSTIVMNGRTLPESFPSGTRELAILVKDRAVTTVFQPIVKIADGSVAAMEALGRGRHPGLPESPGDLFRIAASIGLEAELSRVFRIAAIEFLGSRENLPPVFLNTHPIEMEGPELLRSLTDLRALVPDLAMVMEVHERFFAETERLRRMQDALEEIRVQIAFDDFGAGQARLVELAEVPPDFLKFDISFIRDIDRAPASKRRLLIALVAAATDLGVVTIAEGVETQAEHAVCAQAGFVLGQGYYYGRPVPLDELLAGEFSAGG